MKMKTSLIHTFICVTAFLTAQHGHAQLGNPTIDQITLATWYSSTYTPSLLELPQRALFNYLINGTGKPRKTARGVAAHNSTIRAY